MTASLSEDAITHRCTCSEPPTYTVPEVAELLGLGINQTYSAIRRGELPSIRIGSRILVSRRRLLEMLDGGTPPEAA
jgi:excisionase family DNA binding protein